MVSLVVCAGACEGGCLSPSCSLLEEAHLGHVWYGFCFVLISVFACPQDGHELEQVYEDGFPVPLKREIDLRPAVRGKRSNDVLQFYTLVDNRWPSSLCPIALSPSPRYQCSLCKEKWEYRRAVELLQAGQLLCAVNSVPLVSHDPPPSKVPRLNRAGSDIHRHHLIKEHGAREGEGTPGQSIKCGFA